MPPHTTIESKYQDGIDRLTPAERVARSATMFAWTRNQIARQIVSEQGDMDPAESLFRGLPHTTGSAGGC